MKDKGYIFNFPFDIFHLSLEEIGLPGFSSLTNGKYQMEN